MRMREKWGVEEKRGRVREVRMRLSSRGVLLTLWHWGKETPERSFSDLPELFGSSWKHGIGGVGRKTGSYLVWTVSTRSVRVTL